MKAAAIVEAIGVGTRFGRSNWVHRGLDLTVGRGDVLAMVGGSGSGKTTLLRHINGLTRPTEGHIAVFGSALFRATGLRIAACAADSACCFSRVRCSRR